jgi:hypothetical protein
MYGDWQRGQRALMDGLAPRRKDMAGTLIGNMDAARQRIEGGINVLKNDPLAREAFVVMNTAMAMANRQREAALRKISPEAIDPPKWRPFQLAFTLLNLAGMTDKASPERDVVDLLFFPTGGGKTEAYLGLAAYAISLRRIRGPGTRHRKTRRASLVARVNSIET